MPKFKRDVAPLLDRSMASLTLAIELFNRPSELGRSPTVLILLQHAFELLLKAALLQRGRPIADADNPYTYGFERILRIAEQDLRIVTPDEAATLAILDAQRDQVQHFWAEVSEDVLYLHAQSSVTLYDRLLKANFATSLAAHLPSRVLPISTCPPTDLSVLFERELQDVDALLAKGTRKSARALARLRSVLAFAIGSREDHSRVSERELADAVRKRRRGIEWELILPEIAQLRMTTEGGGIPLTVRIAKAAPIAVRVARPGEAVVGTLVKQEINVWDKFNLGLNSLADKLNLSTMRVLALIYDLDLQSDPDAYHLLQRGKTKLKGYSKKALEVLREAVAAGKHEEAWARHGHRLSGRRRSTREP